MNTSQTIQSIPLSKINQGKYFVASFIDVLPSLSSKKWSILVGADDINLGFEIYSSKRCFVTFYINSNTTGSASSKPFNNANHNSLETTDVELVTGLSGSDGTPWARSAAYPTQEAISGNNTGTRSKEFILSANSTHVLFINSDETGTMNYSLKVGFYVAD